MQSFLSIREMAAERHGGDGIAFPDGAGPLGADQLAAIADHRFLSMATRCIFQSGFNWKVVDAKWPQFEAAFEGFELPRWVMADDDVSRLLSDPRVIRNGRKLSTVPVNARLFARKSTEHGSVGRWIGNWPLDDQVGLMAILEAEGSFLGGVTGQYFLRFMGKDCFILSRDVTAALVRAGVIDGPAKSTRAMVAVQVAFDRWREESGLSLTTISRTLARSIDAATA